MLRLSNLDGWWTGFFPGRRGTGASVSRRMAAIFLNLRTAPASLQYPNHPISGEMGINRFLQYCSGSGDMNPLHNSLYYMGSHRKSMAILLYIQREAPQTVSNPICVQCNTVLEISEGSLISLVRISHTIRSTCSCFAVIIVSDNGHHSSWRVRLSQLPLQQETIESRSPTSESFIFRSVC